MSVENIVR